VEIRAHIASGKPALILARAGTTVDFAELEKRANRLAHFWRAAGLREGDTVAAILENNEHVHAVMWAARRSGLYYALINTHLTAAEAAYIVDNSSAKALIGSRVTRPVCEGLAEHLRGGLPELLLLANPRRQSPTNAKAICCSIRREQPAGPRGSAVSFRI
jgi:fatty-acyl-CoA synthase